MESRIHNKRKMKQLIDFKGCAVDGGMYPTDIDGVIEYKDSKYIIFEVKYGDSEIPIGQRLALQRMVDDFTKSGKQAIVLICSHTVKNPNKPVVMAWCNVREMRNDGALQIEKSKSGKRLIVFKNIQILSYTKKKRRINGRNESYRYFWTCKEW